MEWIKNHKLLLAFFMILLLFIIIIIIVLSTLLAKNNVSEYGDRLKGIEKVQIKKDTFKNIEKEISENESVDKVSVNLEGRLINVILNFNSASLDEAKEIGNKVLEYFDEEEKSFYDIQVFLKTNDEKNEEYPKIGYKHKTSEGIVWN